MGRGKKNKGSKQLGNNQQLMQNQQIPHNSQKLSQKQEMSERNLVQEEGFESDDELNNAKSSMVKVDMRGSDSEEDNAAAGGGLVSKDAETKEKKILQQSSHTNLHKKKNKEANSKLNTHVVDQRAASAAVSTMSSLDHIATPNNMQPRDGAVFNYEHLGRIVMRLLPLEHQAERLPDGRYIMTAAAVGYLAQKLGH